MLRQTPNRRHRWLAPANSGLESSYESRPGYHPVEVHTQAGPTQVSLHNQAVEALVGDPKQSVYRFRRADIRCYKQAKDAIQKKFSENVLPVTDNFRSRKPILDFVNQRFAGPLNSIGYEPLVCTVASSGEEGSSIGRIPIGKEGSAYKVQEWRELEASGRASTRCS